MNKVVFATVAVFVLLVVGLAGFIVINDKKVDVAPSTVEQLESGDFKALSGDGSESTSNPLGLDTSTPDSSYRVTVLAKESENETVGVVEVDSLGNTKTTITENGKTRTVILFDGTTYSQSADSDRWVLLPNTDRPLVQQAIDIGFSDKDIQELNNNDSIKYARRENCAPGICRVYTSTEIKTGEKATIKIDDATNKLSEILLSSATGGTTLISYEYDVRLEIEAPKT